MGKTAIITGGSRGIGRAIALRLAGLGYDIVVDFEKDSSIPKAAEVCREAERMGVKAISVQSDVGTLAGCEKIFSEAYQAFGEHVEVLVNNAGIVLPIDWIDATPAQMERVVAVNLMGQVRCCYLALPTMIKQGGGCIINVASVAGLQAFPHQVCYTTVKHGLIGLTRELAMEYAAHKIRVNVICPGATWTDMVSDLVDHDYSRGSHVPLGRYGSAEEMADAAEYLVKSAYTTGSAISPNGGLITY